MKKAFEYAETLAHEYKDLLKGKSFQKVFKEHKKDSYSSSYAGGTVKLQAMGANASVYAVRELIMGHQSGHAGEFYGSCAPRFWLRPLWVGCDTEVKVGEAMISLPSYLLDNVQHVNLFCCRMLELGYNAVMFGRRGKSKGKQGQCDVAALFKMIREYGIQIILSVDGKTPVTMELEFDFLFKEAKGSDLKSKKTQVEKFIAEVKELEKLNKKLIYYLPVNDEAEADRQSEWMGELSDEMGPASVLAFSCMAGPATENYLGLHPFWKKLRESPDVSATPFLPVVNLGSVGCGEGLWPSLNLRIMDRVFGQMNRHVFAGVLGIVGQLPKRGGLLDCSLWCASQYLWNGRRVDRSAESWFLANHADADMEWNKYFEVLEGVVCDIQGLKGITGELSQDESKAIAESIMGRLKEIQLKLESIEKKKLKKGEGVSLYDYFLPFERDARRLVLQFLQRYHVAMASLLSNDDVQEAFWTQFQGTRSGKVTVLEEPICGSGSQKMKKIFDDNRLF